MATAAAFPQQFNLRLPVRSCVGPGCVFWITDEVSICISNKQALQLEWK
jgi:hypothetical protein